MSNRNAFLYTTSSGIKSVPVRPSSTPSDYDYSNYNLFDLYQSEYDDHAVLSKRDFSLKTDDKMMLLFDISNLFTCYDGTLPSLPTPNSNTFPVPGQLSPFQWYMTSTQKESIFPANKPNFGMNYFPIILWTGNFTKDEKGPTGETYVFSKNLTDIQAYTVSNKLDFTRYSLMLLAINPDNSLFYLTFFSSNEFGEMSSNILQTPDGSYSFLIGTRDKEDVVWTLKVTNFIRIAGSDYNTITSFDVVDGPDCASVNMCNYSAKFYMRKQNRY